MRQSFSTLPMSVSSLLGPQFHIFFFLLLLFNSLLSLPSVTDWHPSSPIFTLIQINFLYCKADPQTSTPLCDISMENEDKVP